jgi:hypothetical protein
VFSNFPPGNDLLAAIRCGGHVISEPLLSNGLIVLFSVYNATILI